MESGKAARRALATPKSARTSAGEAGPVRKERLKSSAASEKTQDVRPWREVFRRVPVSTLVATFFGVGFLPLVPGTWGSLVTIPLAHAVDYSFGLLGLLALALTATLAGIVAAGRTAKARGVGDPGAVVIDEVAGQTFSLLAVYVFCPFSHTSFHFWGFVAIAFVLFRVLDILKPGPIGWLERLPGGWGIMADDVAAGIFLCLALSGALVLLYRQ